MNNFNKLCSLASEEQWCWKLFCTTCGHLHFRYALLELAKGKSPKTENWIVHRSNTNYSKTIGPLPFKYSEVQEKSIISICCSSNIEEIHKSCKFPDWLGYLGLILEHINSDNELYETLSSSWATQLSNVVSMNSLIHSRLREISIGNGLLDIHDLENVESDIINSKYCKNA